MAFDALHLMKRVIIVEIVSTYFVEVIYNFMEMNRRLR